MRHALLAAALIAAPATVMAEGFSYSYLDARYFSTDTDAVSVNQQGGALSGSFALTPMFYVAADGSYGKSEKVAVGTATGSFETISGSARLGAHYPITEVLDVLANAGALYGEVKGKGAFNGESEDDIGYVGEVGLRLALIPKLEVGAFYNYQDIFSDSTSAFTAELQYHVVEKFTVVGSAVSGRNADVYTIGGRYHF
ncbi:MAG: outer membrane beta-barrel protein [Stagnimonas sp.]|nr:outer membrane beta-barrel protein [Stagnimonas sp.]